MRHRKSGRKFNRDSAHRRAMFRNLTVSLVEHEVIKTTLMKAKELRRVAEPLITLAKQDSVANRRLAFSRLGNKAAVTKLFEELGPRFDKRPGGYVRVLKCGFRQGDSAPMAYIELLDRPAEGEFVEEVEAAPVAKSAPKTEAPAEKEEKATPKKAAEKPAEAKKPAKETKAEKPAEDAEK